MQSTPVTHVLLTLNLPVARLALRAVCATLGTRDQTAGRAQRAQQGITRMLLALFRAPTAAPASTSQPRELQHKATAPSAAPASTLRLPGLPVTQPAPAAAPTLTLLLQELHHPLPAEIALRTLSRPVARLALRAVCATLGTRDQAAARAGRAWRGRTKRQQVPLPARCAGRVHTAHPWRRCLWRRARPARWIPTPSPGAMI